MKVRLAVELLPDGARVVALEDRRGGAYGLVGFATIRDAQGPEDLAEKLSRATGAADVSMEEVVITLPLSLGGVYQALQLPLMKGDELESVAIRELEREIGEEARELQIRTWQFSSDTESANTLVVGLPPDVVETGLRFADQADIPVIHMSTTPTALYHGLLHSGQVPEEGVTGIVYVGEDSGFALYVRHEEWILLHPFPVPTEEEAGADERATAIVREVRQSFMYLRRRLPGAPVDEAVLAGPGLPREDLTLRLQDVLPGAEVHPFSFPGELDLEGLASTGEFLDRQAAYAVPLLLAADPGRMPIDYLPGWAKVPHLRSRFVKGAGLSAAAAVILLVGGWLWGDARLSSARQERAAARQQLREMESEVAAIRASQKFRRWINATEQLRGLSDQHLALGSALLPELSVAVPEGLGLDSLSWNVEPRGFVATMSGQVTAPQSSAANTAFGDFLFALRQSPLFREPEVVRQQTQQLSSTQFAVRFTVKAPLLGEAAASPSDSAGGGGQIAGGGGSGGSTGG